MILTKEVNLNTLLCVTNYRFKGGSYEMIILFQTAFCMGVMNNGLRIFEVNTVGGKRWTVPLGFFF